MHALLFVVRRNFWECGSYLATSHRVAFDHHFENVRPGVELHHVLLTSHKKAHGIQSHFKFWAYTNKASPNELLDALPRKLQSKQVIIVVLTSLSTSTRFDVSTVVQVTLLLFKVELNPVMKPSCST